MKKKRKTKSVIWEMTVEVVVVSLFIAFIYVVVLDHTPYDLTHMLAVR